MTVRTAGQGWRALSFACSYEVADLCARRLAAYSSISAVLYRDGALRAQIDLSRLPAGDGPAFAMMVTKDLERIASRHCLPSEPPPDEAAE